MAWIKWGPVKCPCDECRNLRGELFTDDVDPASREENYFYGVSVADAIKETQADLNAALNDEVDEVKDEMLEELDAAAREADWAEQRDDFMEKDEVLRDILDTLFPTQPDLWNAAYHLVTACLLDRDPNPQVQNKHVRSMLEMARSYTLRSAIKASGYPNNWARTDGWEVGDFIDYVSTTLMDLFGYGLDSSTNHYSRAFWCLARATVSNDMAERHIYGALTWIDEELEGFLYE